MKEPKVFCDCNNDWEIVDCYLNPSQLTDRHLLTPIGSCPVCHLKRWHDAYYENEQFNKEKQTMTEYITEPIDYTGCDPIIPFIAKHLKRGQKILYSAGKGEKVWVIAFDSGCDGQLVYRVNRTDNERKFGWVSNPVPISRPKKIKMIMPPERALPILFAAGYSFDGSGNLDSADASDSLFACNLRHFGQPLDKAPGWFHNHPEIIEEVDE